MISPMSTKAKINNFAREKGIPMQVAWQNYIFERFLERMASSAYKDKFVLKGGVLIGALVGLQIRATMDLDFTIKSYPLDEAYATKAIKEICSVNVDDGLSFDLRSSKQIRQEAEYEGYKVMLEAKSTTGNLRFHLPIDITTGDVITPSAVERDIPCMLDKNRHIKVWSYNVETILAEKIHAVLYHGTSNSRARDFYDIYMLTKTQDYDKEIFREALIATTEQRNSREELKSASTIFEKIEKDIGVNDYWKQYQSSLPYLSDISFKMVMEQLKNVVGELEINKSSFQQQKEAVEKNQEPLQRKELKRNYLYGPGTLIVDDDKATLKLSLNLEFDVPRDLLADKPYKAGDVIRVQRLRHSKEGLIIREADKTKGKDIER